MFKRSRDTHETADAQTDGPQVDVETDDATDVAPAAEATVDADDLETADDVEATDASELLRRLADNGSTETTPDSDALTQLSDELARHADSIGVSARAQREAQRLLGMVARERAKVSAEASVMLAEAQELAGRLRTEAEEHAEKERERTRRRAAKAKAEIETLQVELRSKAEDDVADYTATAQREALDKARQEARDYVEHATRVGAQDAEEHRREARAALERSQELVAGTAETVRDLVDGLSKGLETLGTQLEELRTLSDRVSTDLQQAHDRPSVDELVEQALEEVQEQDLPAQEEPKDETTADQGLAADQTVTEDPEPEAEAAAAPVAPEKPKKPGTQGNAHATRSAAKGGSGRSTSRTKPAQRSGRPLGAMYGEDDSRRKGSR